MTPVIHGPALPRTIAGNGRASRRYPAGRVCATPGCRTLLRRTNPGPLCDPCIDNAEARSVASACGRPDSAHGEAVANAAPAVRAVATQEVDVERNEREPAILAYLEQHAGWQNSPVMAGDLGIIRGTLMGDLTRMVRAGLIVSRPANVGGGYRIATAGDFSKEPPPDPVSQSEPADCDKEAPTAPGRDAPAESQPEAPAEEAPVPDNAAPRLPGPVPFAGLTPVDVEIAAIGECVVHMELLDTRARVRVLSYLMDRYAS